jgi:hypothetical protein
MLSQSKNNTKNKSPLSETSGERPDGQLQSPFNDVQRDPEGVSPRSKRFCFQPMTAAPENTALPDCSGPKAANAFLKPGQPIRFDQMDETDFEFSAFNATGKPKTTNTSVGTAPTRKSLAAQRNENAVQTRISKLAPATNGKKPAANPAALRKALSSDKATPAPGRSAPAIDARGKAAPAIVASGQDATAMEASGQAASVIDASGQPIRDTNPAVRAPVQPVPDVSGLAAASGSAGSSAAGGFQEVGRNGKPLKIKNNIAPRLDRDLILLVDGINRATFPDRKSVLGEALRVADGIEIPRDNELTAGGWCFWFANKTDYDRFMASPLWKNGAFGEHARVHQPTGVKRDDKPYRIEPKKLRIDGVPLVYDVEDVKSSLNKANISYVRVVEFKANRSAYNRPFMVELATTEGAKATFKLISILIGVKRCFFSEMKDYSSSVRLCRRCQRVHDNPRLPCTAEFRCSDCGGAHPKGTDTCPVVLANRQHAAEADEVRLAAIQAAKRCPNCSEQHSAAYGKCTYMAAAVKKTYAAAVADQQAKLKAAASERVRLAEQRRDLLLPATATVVTGGGTRPARVGLAGSLAPSGSMAVSGAGASGQTAARSGAGGPGQSAARNGAGAPDQSVVRNGGDAPSRPVAAADAGAPGRSKRANKRAKEKDALERRIAEARDEGYRLARQELDQTRSPGSSMRQPACSHPASSHSASSHSASSHSASSHSASSHSASSHSASSHPACSHTGDMDVDVFADPLQYDQAPTPRPSSAVAVTLTVDQLSTVLGNLFSKMLLSLKPDNPAIALNTFVGMAATELNNQLGLSASVIGEFERATTDQCKYVD